MDTRESAASRRHGRRIEAGARTAQEAADAYERSRIGGLFFCAVWALICVTAAQDGAREWLIGAGFLVLAAARIAVNYLRRRMPGAHGLHLAATLAVMVTTMLAWGCATAFALISPDYVDTTTVILFATSAFTTAYVHNYPMRLLPAYAGLAAGYGPPFVALLVAHRRTALPIAIGVFIHSLYLVLAARRAHYEYHRSLELEHELRTQRDQFAWRSRIDALTGLGNRGEFNDRLTVAVEDSLARGETLALLIVDIDHFKAVNDERGHATGDACLVAIASRLAQAFARPGEFTARLGGEEFAALLPDTSVAEALARAETFRAALAAQPLALEGEAVPITVSVGVGAFERAGHVDGEALYRDVDAALYRPKREGRNRVEPA